MFFMLRKWRRNRILRTKSIPDALWNRVIDTIPTLRRLNADELVRLRELALIFLHEKTMEPVGGIRLDVAMRVRIAVLACLPILNLGPDCYEDFVSVIVYPGEFLVRNRQHLDEAGVLHASDDILSGEAWERGPVVLSWSDIEASGHGDGYNVVVHEFAHKLDALGGVVNGVPPLHKDMRMEDWTAAFQSAYDNLCQRVDADEDTWLDPYAAENPGEFFAVCSEMFFERPGEFHDHYPALYAQMSAFFRQNPAAR